jgi:hypothetical protein
LIYAEITVSNRRPHPLYLRPRRSPFRQTAYLTLLCTTAATNELPMLSTRSGSRASAFRLATMPKTAPFYLTPMLSRQSLHIMDCPQLSVTQTGGGLPKRQVSLNILRHKYNRRNQPSPVVQPYLYAILDPSPFSLRGLENTFLFSLENRIAHGHRSAYELHHEDPFRFRDG